MLLRNSAGVPAHSGCTNSDGVQLNDVCHVNVCFNLPSGYHRWDAENKVERVLRFNMVSGQCRLACGNPHAKAHSLKCLLIV